jgi:hypothetical protein
LLTTNDMIAHDTRWFAAHDEWPPMPAASASRVAARAIAEEIVNGLMARGAERFAAHTFDVVRGQGRAA